LTVFPQNISGIDLLAGSDSSFAIFRLPQSSEPVLIVQRDGLPQSLSGYNDLDGREGFVLAPFHITPACRLLLIRPDETVNGWVDIVRFAGSVSPVTSSRSVAADEPVRQEGGNRSRYAFAFGKFMEALRQNRFSKLVLSRSVTELRPAGFSPAVAFAKACESYPNAFVYLCHTPLSGTWMGSSPEVLLHGHHSNYQTVALAGTRKLNNEGAGANRWNSKNRNEQQLVADYIRRVLGECAESYTEEPTGAQAAGNVVHLRTGFEFVYRQTDKLGTLLNRFHPTPAVCGLPKDEARLFIIRNEGYDREYYAGFTGFVSPDKQTDLYVNLRCMKIGARQLSLYAGGGLLTSSNRETEWRETEEKLKTMRRII
jgi:isochorismate synthase